MDELISESFFLSSNNGLPFVDASLSDGCEGTKIIEKDGKKLILRFKDGRLDGESGKDSDGMEYYRPAVEGPGHIEYWCKGFLHRQNGPAVITNGFAHQEWWLNGKITAVKDAGKPV